MSVAVVCRRLALAAVAASSCGVAQATDEAPVQARVERSDTRGVSEVSLGRWTHAGRADIGWGVGKVSLIDRPEIAAPTLMLGLRYRASDRALLYAGATHVRGIGVNGDDEVVSKVGIELKSSQSLWHLTYGGLGMHFSDNARMTLKARRGGLELSMRSNF